MASQQRRSSDIDKTFDQRLSRLEATVEGVAGHVESLANTVDRLAASLQAYSKTDMKALASWAAIIISVGVLAFAPVLHDTARLQQRADEAENSVVTLSVEVGRLSERVRQNNDDIALVRDEQPNALELLDTMLQREMRQLDKVLQRELKLGDQITRERIDAVEKKFELYLRTNGARK